MLFDIAKYLVTSQEPGNRWRRIALPSSVAITTLLFLVTFSLINGLWREDYRAWSLATAEYFSEGLPGTSRIDGVNGLYVSENADYWQERQYFQLLIEPVGASADVLPPGLNRLPEPGQAAVSPALAHAIETWPELKARYPSYFLLESEGVPAAGDLFAWVRPLDRDQFLQREPLIVYSFNNTSESPNTNRRAMQGVLDKPLTLITAGIAILVPGVLLLSAGMLSSSSTRLTRTRLLHQLGASRRTIFSLTFLETAMTAIPISVLLVLLWLPISGQLQAVPFLQRSVFRGDLQLALWQTLLVLTGVIVLIAVSAGILVQLRKANPTRSRRWRTVALYAVKGIGMATALLIPWTTTDSESERGILMFLGGTLVIIMFAPTMIGFFLASIGALLQRIPTVTTELAGSQMRSLREGASRPFAAVAVIAILGMIALGALAFVNRVNDYYDASASPASVRVRTVVDQETTTEAIKTAVPDATVFPVVYTEAGEVVVASCHDIATAVGDNFGTCENATEPTLNLFGSTFYDRHIRIDPQAVVPNGTATDLLVVSRDMTMEGLDSTIRSALPPAAFPWLRVYSPELFSYKQPAASAWIQRASVALVCILAITATGSIVDQTVSRNASLRLLTKLGIDTPRFRRVSFLRFWVNYLTSLVIGLGIGWFLATIFKREYGFDWPVANIIAFTGMFLLTGVVSSILVVNLEEKLAWHETQR